MKPMHFSYLLVFLCASIYLSTKNVIAQETVSPPNIEIFMGKRYSSDDNGKHYYFQGTAYALTKKTNIKVTKRQIIPDANVDSLYEVIFSTSDFTTEKDYSYFLKCGDKVFQIRQMGGNGKIMSVVVLPNLSQDMAEFLTGRALPKAPKDELVIAYEPQRSYNPGSNINVSIMITHDGQDNLSIYWGTLGDGQGDYKDAQLKFSAAMNGNPVKANPHPVPDGFLSSRHLFKPRTALRRNANLAKWLDFTKPGLYHVTAIYTIEIQNPNAKSDAVQSWKVKYQNEFDVQVTAK
jgi:hypothetical protein